MKRAVVAAALLVVWPSPRADASWAICEGMLTGATIIATTELEAKQKALADWVDQSRAIGVAYTRWQLAWNRRLICDAADGAKVRCTARGRPCRISQVPPPAGSEILKPGDITD